MKQQEIEQKLLGTMLSQDKVNRVQEKLGYTFRCKTWLVEALTHKSAID
jgi:dsRNA-specific ribonuclease